MVCRHISKRAISLGLNKIEGQTIHHKVACIENAVECCPTCTWVQFHFRGGALIIRTLGHQGTGQPAECPGLPFHPHPHIAVRVDLDHLAQLTQSLVEKRRIKII